MAQVAQIGLERARADAFIFAHHYQRAEIKGLADAVGGSRDLWRAVLNMERAAVVVCGVDFMAETARRLRPDINVLVPREDALCPYAQRVGARELLAARGARPARLIAAETKASAAVKEMADLLLDPEEEAPLRVARGAAPLLALPSYRLYRDGAVADAAPPGAPRCQIHAQISLEETREAQRRYPGALLAVNSLCLPSVRESADFSGDSAALWEYCAARAEREIILVAESGLRESLLEKFPGSALREVETEMFCPNMKLTNIKDVLRVLEACPSPAQGNLGAVSWGAPGESLPEGGAVF
jgi:quinolinate synthase